MKIVPGPDFRRGYIAGPKHRSAYKTGRGSFTMRAKAASKKTTKTAKASSSRNSVSGEQGAAIERIAELCRQKIEGISDVRDESRAKAWHRHRVKRAKNHSSS